MTTTFSLVYQRYHRQFTWGFLLVVVGLGVGLRLYVRHTAPPDYDEDNYLSAARTFREAIDAGEWSEIPNVTNNAEHPPLVKLLYSLVLDKDDMEQIPPPQNIKRGSRLPLPHDSLQNTRLQAVVFSGLTILLVAFINPLGALALDVQSVHLYYGSLAYLDALPTLMTALAAWLYTQQSRHRAYFWLSAACFGIGVAAKYPFALVGVALLLHALVYRQAALPKLIAWGGLSILVFFIFNPYLYPDPLGRVSDQLSFHQEYAENQNPHWSRPITQLTSPDGFLPDNIDGLLKHALDLLIFGLSLVGLPLLLRDKSVYGWWLVIGMLFLMFWNTQWVQHKMMIVVPYSLSAAVGLRWLWQQASSYLPSKGRAAKATSAAS